MDFVLNRIFATTGREPPPQRPTVCLTWAQSLDGKLASSPSTPTLISGAQSMQMTHALRALHDAILVGVGTACADNPRLTCRIDDETQGMVGALLEQYQRNRPANYDPLPVVLDSRLRTPLFTKFLHTPREENQKPLVFCSNITDHQTATSLRHYASVIPVPEVAKTPDTIRLSLPDILRHLRERGIKSLMVEGGAKVISSFVDQGLWDVAAITIAPAIFGSGVALQHEKGEQARKASLSNVSWTQLEQDVVMVGFPT
ncbi:unnamed protein product [Agarophyton chilense]